MNGEGDGLPGLVIDVYGPAAVVKLDGAGPEGFYDAAGLAAWLTGALPGLCTVFLKYRSGAEERGRLLAGEPPAGPVRFLENGLSFAADIVMGQARARARVCPSCHCLLVFRGGKRAGRRMGRGGQAGAHPPKPSPSPLPPPNPPNTRGARRRPASSWTSATTGRGCARWRPGGASSTFFPTPEVSRCTPAPAARAT